jgi:trk system potassium uptake protein TrkH
MEILGANPGRKAILYFAVTILIGSVVLTLPVSGQKGPVAYIDALFTSTSAVCVTGLTSVNTALDYSRFGQVVIMILIQLGGLGVLTFTTTVLLMMGSRLSFEDRLGLSQSFSASPRAGAVRLIKAVIIVTAIVESLGAVGLFAKFQSQYPAGEAAFHALFHSVAAFCNAGFSTFPDNLEGYSHSLSVILIISGLIIFGGLGFAVISEVYDRARNRKTILSVHTKICVTATAALLVLGTLGIWLAEHQGVFKDSGIVYTLSNCFFQSVTARTAGFNSIAQARLTDMSVLVTIILMFIGACPGSTGGGIKTTTMTVILLLVYNRFRGRQTVPAFKRSISNDSVVRALTVALLAALIIVVMLGLLLFAEEVPRMPGVGHGWLIDTLFEIVSAFGTVGLTLGLTPYLSVLGKIIVIFTMFIGRVGLLTLAFALIRPPQRGEIVYIDESVMVG